MGFPFCCRQMIAFDQATAIHRTLQLVIPQLVTLLIIIDQQNVKCHVPERGRGIRPHLCGPRQLRTSVLLLLLPVSLMAMFQCLIRQIIV